MKLTSSNQQNIMSITLFLFYILRLYTCILPGYIHPDEYFQGGQELWFSTNNNNNTNIGTMINNVSQKSIFTSNNNNNNCNGDETTLIWEYKAKNAIRSIIPPYIMTLFPLKIYNYVTNNITSHKSSISIVPSLTGYEILVIPRLFLHILSFISFDVCLWEIVNNIKKE